MLTLMYCLLKQEAHGPWLARLSEIAIADMQLLWEDF